MPYPQLQLFIDSEWIDAGTRRVQDVVDPATDEVIAQVPHANPADLDRALDAADRAFRGWSRTPPVERGAILHAVASRLRVNAERIGETMTLEQGKPLSEARAELLVSADILDWSAEEARRSYGRIIPGRIAGLRQSVLLEPLGTVAALTPWNAPAFLPARKIGEALAAGCTCVIKPAEETPGSALELVRAFAECGLPAGVLNMVFGVPADVSSHLIASPVVRKISFTGSTEVGRQLAALAARGPKRITLELGGHAPAIVCADADIEAAAHTLASLKYRNCGQLCGSPTRILVQRSVLEPFTRHYVASARAVKVGSGLAPASTMGPLANKRRLAAMQRLVSDAQETGAEILTGGRHIGSRGNFWEPTVVMAPAPDSLLMTQEPFGPVSALLPFDSIEEAIAEANRLDYGLAAYAFTRSAHLSDQLAEALECGAVGINTCIVTGPETPFGGVKASGYGSEGGSEGLLAYMSTKYIARA